MGGPVGRLDACVHACQFLLQWVAAVGVQVHEPAVQRVGHVLVFSPSELGQLQEVVLGEVEDELGVLGVHVDDAGVVLVLVEAAVHVSQQVDGDDFRALAVGVAGSDGVGSATELGKVEAGAADDVVGVLELNLDVDEVLAVQRLGEDVEDAQLPVDVFLGEGDVVEDDGVLDGGFPVGGEHGVDEALQRFFLPFSPEDFFDDEIV